MIIDVTIIHAHGLTKSKGGERDRGMSQVRKGSRTSDVALGTLLGLMHHALRLPSWFFGRIRSTGQRRIGRCCPDTAAGNERPDNH